MPEHVLEKLFDSVARVRLLKLFLRNEGVRFSLSDIRKRTQVDNPVIRRQLDDLRSIGFIKANAGKTVFKKGKGKRAKKRKVSREQSYSLNPNFVFYHEVRGLVLKASPASKRWMEERIKSTGRIKLVVLSGIFLHPEREEQRSDLLIVGDDISERRLANFIRALEAEVGAEVMYSVLTGEEYAYRIQMFDRFLLDILEKPHEKLINRMKE